MKLKEKKERKAQLLRSLWQHRTPLALSILALAVVILAVCLRSAGREKTDLMDRLAQAQTEQEDLQEMFDALKRKAEEQEETHSRPPVITSETVTSQLSGLKDLVTQSYIYTNAAKRESSETWMFGWTRPFSSNSILITYDGYIKAGIDLSQIQVSVDEDSRTITVTLPDSRITDNNIPQESIVVIEVKDGLFNEVTFDDYNQFISEEKAVMEQKAIGRGLLAQADAEAEAAVRSLLSLLPGIDAYTLVIQ